jgi:hypothetical protein
MTTEFFTKRQAERGRYGAPYIEEMAPSVMSWELDHYDGPRGAWLPVPHEVQKDLTLVAEKVKVIEWWVWDLRCWGGPILCWADGFDGDGPRRGGLRFMPTDEESDQMMDEMVASLRADGARYMHPQLIEMFDQRPKYPWEDPDPEWLEMDTIGGDGSALAYYLALAVLCGLGGFGLAMLVIAYR